MEQKNHRQTAAGPGRAMLMAGWALGLLMLALLFSGVLEGQRQPNRQAMAVSGEDGMRELVLQRNRAGHYLAPGEINGQKVEFLLDTGASDVSVPAALARRLGLERGQSRQYSTANGTITAHLTRIPRLLLGGIELHDVRASINPHMPGETVLLGMSVLRQLEFTQSGDKLIIRHYP